MRDFHRAVGAHGLLNREDEVNLARAMEEGDKRAREKLINSNYRLAISIAKKYSNRGYEYEDLIQESFLGLIKAVDRFDHRRGVKFSTYATWWIKQSVSRLVTENSSAVKMPPSANLFHYRAQCMIRDYTRDLGHAPNDQEVADFMGVGLNTYLSIMNCYGKSISLDQTTSGDSESPKFGDIIPDTVSETSEDLIDREKSSEIIRLALASLTPREEKVIRMRFGIVEDPQDHENFPITAEEIEELNRRSIEEEV